MPDDEVVIRFGAQDDGLSAQVQKIKSELSGLSSGGAAGGGILTPPPYAFGGPPQTLLEKATEAAKKGIPVSREWADKCRDAARAEEELGEASQRSANLIERMSQRMLIRLVVFGAIFKAIQEIVNLFKETAVFEEAGVRFDNLATAADRGAQSFQQLAGIAHETATPITDVTAAAKSLREAGISGQPAVDLVKNLAEYAKVAGEPLTKLSETMGRLSQHQASLQEMINTADLLGESTRRAVHEFNLRTINQPIIEAHEQRSLQLAERQAEWDKRRSDAQTEYLQKIGYAETVYDRFMAHGGVAAIGVSPAMHTSFESLTESMGAMWDKLRVGAQQMAAENNTTFDAIIHHAKEGEIGMSDLLAAYERFREEQRMIRQEAEQDRRWQIEEGHRQENIRLQAQEFAELQRGTGLQQEFAKQMGTVAGQMEKAGADMKALADNSQSMLQIMEQWAQLVTQVVGGFKSIHDHAHEIAQWTMKALDNMQKLVPWFHGTEAGAARGIGQRRELPTSPHHWISTPALEGRPQYTPEELRRIARSNEGMEGLLKVMIRILSDGLIE
jgi:hypothetical protein